MTDEQKEILDIKFPKELPKGHTEAEKLKAAQWEIARLKKALDENKAKDTLRRQLWLSVVERSLNVMYTFEEMADAANEALKHYDKTFYGH